MSKAPQENAQQKSEQQIEGAGNLPVAAPAGAQDALAGAEPAPAAPASAEDPAQQATQGSATEPASAPARKPQGKDEKVTRMGTASIPLLILEFAIPSIVGMLVNGAYNIIDSIFLGQAMGEIGLSVATVANPIMTVFMALAMLVGNGGNALAALRLGEGRRNDAERALGNTVFLSIILSMIVAVVAAIPASLDTLLTISGATEEVRPYSATFVRIICFGFLLQCIGMGVNNFIRTAGAPNRALLTMVAGLIVSTVFNFLFVLVLGWGVFGSAMATIIGQGVSCLMVLWYFTMTKDVPLKLYARNVMPQLRVVGSILSLGLASFVVQVGAAVVSFILNKMLVTYGEQTVIGATGALASIGVVQRVAMFTVLPLIGIAVAIQPLLGFNYGAKLLGRVRKTFWWGCGAATVLAVAAWGTVHLFPEAIVGVFGIRSGELVDFTIFALKVQLLMLPFVGFQIVGSNYFQATGQPLKSIILSLTRQILFLVPLLLTLPQLLPQWFPQYTGLDALYFATPVADFLAIFTTVIFVAVEMRRLKKVEKGEITSKF